MSQEEEEKKPSLEELKLKHQQAYAAQVEGLSRRRALRAIIDEHLASPECMPIETTPEHPDEMELKKKRFLYSLALEADVRADKVHPSLLGVVKKIAHADAFMSIEKAEVGTQLFDMLREIRTSGGIENYIDRFEDEMSKISLLRSKFSIPLEETDFVEGTGTIRREAMDRILQKERENGRKINKIVERPDHEDPYLEMLRTEANKWKAIVDSGLPNVTGDPAEAETQVALHETLELATTAISRYEIEKGNAITRRDRDPSRVVSLPEFERLYAGMNAGRAPLERIDRQGWYSASAIIAAKKVMQTSFSTLLCQTPVVDCSLFVSRMVLLFSFQPMFPVIQFSMQLETLMAATMVVTESVKQMTALEKVERMRQLRRELDEEAKQNAGTFALHQQFDLLPINAQVGMSDGEILASFNRMRETSHKAWKEATTALRNSYAAAMIYYFDEKADRAAMIALGAFQPPHTDAEVSADPFMVTRCYLTNLWIASMSYSQSILKSYEVRLVALLGRFLDTSGYEYWMQQALFPESDHDHVLTTKLTKENNERLAKARNSLFDQYQAIEGYAETLRGFDLEEIEIPIGLAEKPIVDEIPSSPTVAQMVAYHRHCYLLFDLSSEQINLIGKKKKKNKK